MIFRSFIGVLLITGWISTVYAEFPLGWQGGGAPGQYEVGLDYNIAHEGKSSGYIESIVPEPVKFARLTQSFKADEFRGTRVRLSGYVKTENVSGTVGLWMRVDGTKKQALCFDNMEDRPIEGSTEWTQYSIVLDVPDDGEDIYFGLVLDGKGQAWVDDLEFEIVGEDIPTTGISVPEVKIKPINLDFEG